MSGAPDDLKGTFLGVRSTASKPDLSWMLQDNQPAAGATRLAPSPAPAAAAPAAAAASAPAAGPNADDPSQPFGQRIQNFFSRYADQTRAQLQDDQKPLPDTGSAFTGDISAAWDKLKTDFMASGSSSHTFGDLKALGDEFHLITSPIQGATDEATGLAAKALGAITPFLSARQIKHALDNGLYALGPETGGAEAATARAAELGGDAAKGAKAGAGGEPPGGGGAAPGAKPAGEEQPAFTVHGAAPDDALKITPEIRQQAANFFAGKRDNPIDVSLDAVANPATRLDAIKDIAKTIPIDEVKPIDVSQMGAYSLNMTPDQVMAALKPTLPSDELQAAAVMSINSAARVFVEASQRAVESGAAGDAEEATRAYALFSKYVGDYRESGTDLGRGMRMRQEAAGYFDDYTKHIQDVVAGVGPDNMEEVIRKAATLQDPTKVSGWVSSLRWMKSREGMMYGWYNWLLSNPATVVKKLTSDATIGVWNIATRYTAETAGRLGLNSGAVQAGETAALWQGYRGSMRDAFVAAGRALKAGQSQFHGEANSLFDGKVFDIGTKMAQGAPAALDANAPTMGALEYLRAAMPTSWIGAADDFAKTMNYRAELHALAYRRALGDAQGAAGEGGIVDPKTVSDNMSAQLNNVQPDLHEQAVAAAIHNTLSDPLDGIGKSIQDIVDKVNIPIGRTGVEIPLGRIIMPFTKISANVLKFAYRSSPLPFMAPSDAWRADMMAGGARRDLATAQAGLGTAMSAVFLGGVLAGQITGRGPGAPELAQARRNAGIPAYSIKNPITGKWVNYSRIEPVATSIGAIADTVELMRYAHDDDNSQLATSLALGLGHELLSKQYLSGMAQFIEAMDGDERTGERWSQNLLASFATPALAAGVTRATDPWLRQHYDLISTIASRTPGWSTSLPAAQNRWGEDLPRAEGFPDLGGISRMLSPATEEPGQASANPIDKWIWTNRDAFPEGPEGRVGLNMPGQVMTVDNARVQLTPEQLHRIRELAGNGLKDPGTGLGAKDALNALVTGKYPDPQLQDEFNRAPVARQALMVQTMWNRYRAGASQQLQREDNNLRDTISSAAAARQTQLAMPDLGGN